MTLDALETQNSDVNAHRSPPSMLVKGSDVEQMHNVDPEMARDSVIVLKNSPMEIPTSDVLRKILVSFVCISSLIDIEFFISNFLRLH